MYGGVKVIAGLIVSWSNSDDPGISLRKALILRRTLGNSAIFQRSTWHMKKTSFFSIFFLMHFKVLFLLTVAMAAGGYSAQAQDGAAILDALVRKGVLTNAVSF